MNRDDAEAFLYTEARLLDDNDLRAWLELTADDFVYWIPVNATDSDPSRHLSIIHENRKQCAERIFRILDSGLNHSQDPASSTVRFVSNVEVEPDGPSGATVRCNTLLYEYRNHAARRDSIRLVQHPARSEYRLTHLDGRWLMSRKKVTFVHLDGPLDSMCYFI